MTNAETNNGAGLNKYSRDSMTVNNSGELLGYYNKIWNVQTFQYSLNTWSLYPSYTTDHQLYTQLTYDGVSGMLRAGQHFYYQPYTPNSIRPFEIAAPEVKIFPSPANQILTITLNSLKEEDVKFTIVNSDGRLIARWQDKVSGGYLKQVPTSNLPNGIYFLRIWYNNRSTDKAFSVVH